MTREVHGPAVTPSVILPLRELTWTPGELETQVLTRYHAILKRSEPLRN